MSDYQFIGPFTQLLTFRGLPLRGALKDESLAIVEEGALLIRDGVIEKTGKYVSLRKEARQLEATFVDIEGRYVAMPGLIDMHTHLCFAGSRAQDYALRNAGKSYLEIARAGGGIWDTVQHTRAATREELTRGVVQRADRHLRSGVTTIEVKSGYGLSLEEELKMLRAIRDAGAQAMADLIPTCLAAHIHPKDFEGRPAEYLDRISTQLFPLIRKEKLTNRIDAFIEQEAFSPEIIRPYLAKAKSMGFELTLHADQFHPGGSAVAVAFGALSADHLEASTEKEIQLLAGSSTIAAALPGATLGLGCAFTPARRLLDAGAALAIATDWNPGSAPLGDLLTVSTLLGAFEKLSNTEVLAGITYRAAAALNLPDRGRLQSGLLADIIAFPAKDYREICYQQGQLRPDKIWKRGRLIRGDD